MENYIERAGGALPALRQIIETDVGELLHQNLPQIHTAPKAEQEGVLHAVTCCLDDFFQCMEYKLLYAYYARPDAPAQRLYVVECQHTLLQLLGYLVQYSEPAQLCAVLPVGGFKDACCRHVYGGLISLLDYTVELADGQVDAKLRLPLAARALFEEVVVRDLEVLRQHMVALQVSAALIDITLAPFRELAHKQSVTFYQVHYLRMLKEALLQPPLPGYDATGDGRILWTLVVQNYNAPEFIAWFHHVLETHRRDVGRYKARLTTYPGFSLLAWQPQCPSVREQLGQWLDMQLVVTSSDFSTSVEEEELEDEDAPSVDSPYSPDDLTLRNISPQVFAVIANAARMLNYVFWGRDGAHIAEMVACISSIHRPLSNRTVRRGLSNVAILRQAREILQSLIHFFDRQIKKQEEKLYH